MVERSTAAEEKRRVILDAAVRVFARKGFHASRVGDIAEEAGVAHGLLYHYFSSKDEVLETIFREHWTALLDRIHAVEASGDPPIEQLRGIVRAMFHGWRVDPDGACGADPAREECCDPDRTARLRDELQTVEQVRHRVEDLVVRHGHDLVDKAAVHREGELARLRRAEPVGDRARDAHVHALAGGERSARVVTRFRLDADDADSGPQRLRRGRAAGDEPAAADRKDEEVE